MIVEQTRPIGVSALVPDVSGLHAEILRLRRERATVEESAQRAWAAHATAHERIKQLEAAVGRGTGATAAELHARAQRDQALRQADAAHELADELARLATAAKAETKATRAENDDLRTKLVSAHEHSVGLQKRLDSQRWFGRT